MRRNVVNLELGSSRGVLKYSDLASSLAKTVALGAMARRMSLVDGNG